MMKQVQKQSNVESTKQIVDMAGVESTDGNKITLGSYPVSNLGKYYLTLFGIFVFFSEK